MPKYQVLITLNEYREVEADTAKQAVDKCCQNYMNGDYELDSMPEFFCDETDKENV